MVVIFGLGAIATVEELGVMQTNANGKECGQRERKRTQWARALRAPVAGGGNSPPVALGGGDRVGDAELRLMQYKTARWKRRDGHSAEGRFAIEVVFVLV